MVVRLTSHTAKEQSMHCIKFYGESGSGKTLLARRCAKIFGGEFRAPHHTCSTEALLEEMTIAMGGVLYLDEASEFHTNTIKALIAKWKRIGAVIGSNVPVLILAINEEDLDKDLWPEGITIDTGDYGVIAFCGLFDRLTEPQSA